MAISIEAALGNHDKALALRSQRAEILASNITNADTPGYQARDFDFASVFNSLTSGSASGLTTTNKSHISLQDGLVPAGQMQYRVPDQSSLDGNTVDLMLEQASFTRNAMDFQASFTFLNSKISGIRSALRGD